MPLRFYMNDSEMCRRELLRQTRRLYDDKREIPAVHPRYGRIYHNLYENNTEEQEPSGGTFYIRLVLVCPASSEKSTLTVSGDLTTTRLSLL